MDLHRHAAFQRAWRRSPPLQVIAQAWIGFEPPEDADDVPPHLRHLDTPALPTLRTSADEDAAIADFAAAFAAAGGHVLH